MGAQDKQFPNFLAALAYAEAQFGDAATAMRRVDCHVLAHSDGFERIAIAPVGKEDRVVSR